MSLQELKTKEAVQLDETAGKYAQFFLQSSFYKLAGNWHWPMKTDAVFCSDVMLPFPPDFAGAKGIFHPDDVTAVKEKTLAGQTLAFLEFRIITTYGEVKTLVGENIVVTKEAFSETQWQHDAVQTAMQAWEERAAHLHVNLVKEVQEKSERLSGTGAWYYNAASGQTWYSDFVFLLHGLPPQSLNAHLHTFHSFIHPDDRLVVAEFTDKAYQEKTPLQMEYRIVAGGSERWVSYKAHWFFSSNGELICGGIFQDITEQKKAERELEVFKNLVQFQRQQLLYDEQQVNFGHWQINLLTRKITYTDQYYRIFGLKPHSLAPTLTSFLNYVHPDDRDSVEAGYKKIIHQHEAPELQYRIIRADGKTRHLLQKAKLLMYEGEMMISGVIQDVTVQRMLEKKQISLQEKLLQQSWLQQQGDESAGLVSWIVDTEENSIQWSESLYTLLGYSQKVRPQNITEKTLFSIVHPHDLKDFRSQWTKAVEKKESSVFSFRFLQRGAVRYMNAVFNHYEQGGKTYFVGTALDTTAEQTLMDQLNQRVQLAESLTENIPDRVMITDANNNVVLWNQACENTYHIKKAEAIGENFFDLFPHLKTEKTLRQFQEVQRGGKVIEPGMWSETGNGYYDLYMLPLYREAEVTGVLHVVHDATNEADLRKRLNERLQLIESIVQSSVDRIIALDRNMNYLYWNAKAEEYYGLPKEEIIGKNILEVFPQLVNDPSYGELRKALKGETVHIPADPKEEKYFESYLVPIKGEKDEVLSLLWIAHDLQKEYELLALQKEAQQVVADEFRRMKEAEAIGHFGSFEWVLGSGLSKWSDELYRIMGLDPQSEEITPVKIDQFIHPEDWRALQDVKEQSFTQPGSYKIVHRVVRRNGDVLTVNHEWESIADASGKVVKVTGFVQDITRQNKAEQEILRLKDEVAQKATDKYLTLFSSINEGFMVCELIRNETGEAIDYRILELNPALEKQTGMAFEKLHGRTILDVFPNLETWWIQTYASVVDKKTPARFEHFFKDTGEWFEVSAYPMDDDRFAVLYNNITKRKCAEEQAANFTALLERQVAERTEELQLAHNRIVTIFGAVPLQLGYYHAVRNEAGEIEDLQSVVINKGSVDRMSMANGESGQLMSEQLPGLKEQPVWQTIKEVIQTRQPQRTELYYEFGSSPVWFDVLYTPLEDGIISASLDITERKRGEEEIKKNMAILKQSEDIAAIGSWEYQIPSGRFSWSDGMYRIFDYPRGAPVQPEVYVNYAVEEDRGIAKRLVRSLQKTHVPFEETLRIKREDGVRCVKVKATVVNDEKGQPEKVVGVDLDITDIKEAEAQLKKSQYWLEQTTKASPDAITIYDLQKKQPLYLNECLAEWTGYSTDALTYMGIEGRLQLIHDDDRLPLLHFTEIVASTPENEVRTNVYRVIDTNGKILWVRNRSKVFQRDASGKATHLLTILQDVTVEKETEAQLKELYTSLEQKNKDLESKNEEITSFAFVASHDLKEPLRKIHTFTDWLLAKEASISEPGRQNLERLIGSVKRLNMLVDDIVALTKVHVEEEGGMQVDLNAVLQKAMLEMEDVIEAAGAEIVADELPSISGAENHLVYLFKNLLSNSIKFQKPGTKPVIHIRMAFEDDHLKLSFADNGIGFSPEHYKKIFQLFRRLHSRTEYEGTGMGLAICKKIMEKHGGFIKAVSTLGEGSVFCCYFPARLLTAAK